MKGSRLLAQQSLRDSRARSRRRSQLARQWEAAGHVADFFADAIEGGLVCAVLQCFGDEIGDFEHFFFFHSAGGDGRCTDANPARFEDRIGVERNSVFVYRNPGAVENFLRFFSVNFFGRRSTSIR